MKAVKPRAQLGNSPSGLGFRGLGFRCLGFSASEMGAACRTSAPWVGKQDPGFKNFDFRVRVQGFKGLQ